MSDPKAPTVVEDWLRCPQYSVYTRQWELRGEWRPHLALGRAMAVALAVHRRGGDMRAVVAAGQTALVQEFNPDQDGWTLEGLAEIFGKGLTKAVATAIPPHETVVAVEPWIAHSRIDMVTRHPELGLIVTDDKLHMELERRWLPRREAESQTSWQLHHEAWAVSRTMGEPVEWARHHLIVLTPRAWTMYVMVRMGAERLAMWEADALTVWAAMEGPPYRRPQACTLFGGCVFQRGCWTLHGDVSKFPTFYAAKEA